MATMALISVSFFGEFIFKQMAPAGSCVKKDKSCIYFSCCSFPYCMMDLGLDSNWNMWPIVKGCSIRRRASRMLAVGKGIVIESNLLHPSITHGVGA